MAETTQPRRETAKICSVEELTSGTYIVQEGWLPNYVKTKDRKISRVNIMGIVVSKPSLYDFSIDDGSGTIQIVDFNQQKKVADLKIGEPVIVIGRPRLNGETIFIACEIVNVKQVTKNSEWLAYRKEQLKEQKPDELSAEQVIEETPVLVETETKEKAVVKEEKLIADVTGEDILAFIKKKDTGDGCLIEDIISFFGNDIDDHILTLITMGEIYEIKPGKVKVLE